MRRLLPLLAAFLLAAPAARAADLTVLTDNIENMPETTWPAGCEGDWHYLIDWLQTNGRVPDVLLLQQMGGQKKLSQYIGELESKLGAQYSGTLAIDPFVPSRDRLKANGCKADRSLKAFQTNAIVWRTDRLTPQEPVGPYPRCRDTASKQSKTTCFQSVYYAGSCQENTQARTLNAALRFTDGAGRPVSVASIHWGSGNVGNQQANRAGWDRCARDNARRATRAVRDDSDLQVFGGDANLDAKKAGFETYIVKKLRFRDVGARLGATGTSNARRDFLFARTRAKAPAKASSSVVVPWVDGQPHYSDHRAIVTTITY